VKKTGIYTIHPVQVPGKADIITDNMTIPPKKAVIFAVKCQKVLAMCAKVVYNDKAIL
jgi:hypothetical protein